MANQQDAASIALEEITWRSPQHVQMMGGFLHSNNILFYFAESPFFDATSNNASLAIQASYNENFRPFIETRDAFEGRLRTMQGLEFMVAHDPLRQHQALQQQNPEMQEPSNVWVIRKQMRKKRPAGEDEVQVLATYFVVGDSVYMAPSVLSVVGGRMLSTVTSLTKLLSVASPLPLFSPSYGHTYMPPVPKSLEASQAGHLSTQQSKEGTPMPDIQSATAAMGTPQTRTTLPTTSTSSLNSLKAIQDARNLMEAFSLLSRYGDEYMDDHPLVGEPGSFIISKKTAEPPVPARPQSVKANPPGTGTIGKPGTPGAAPPLKTDAATIGVAKSGKGAEKTPVTPSSAGGGGREKVKRRKSKVGSGVS